MNRLPKLSKFTTAELRAIRKARSEHFRLMRQAEEESLHHARIVQKLDASLASGKKKEPRPPRLI